MRTALIPPIPDLNKFGYGDFHLVLSHLLEHPRYIDHYKRMRQQGAYLVLDNSAHEHKEGESARILIQQAMDLRAQEIVVPDCLEDGEKTVQLAVDALELWFEESPEYLKIVDPALMYVPQGDDEDEWADCFYSLVRLHTFISARHEISRNFVIGVSKDYEPWRGGLSNLIEKYIMPTREAVAERGIRMHVHLLGWPRNLWTLATLAGKFPWIRSVDSAKPFVYARNKIALEAGEEVPDYPTRMDNYFTKRLTPGQVSIASWNCSVFMAAAEGILKEGTFV